MWTWDGLSLALCNGWGPFTARDVPTFDGLADIELLSVGERTFTLDPWPFSESRLEVRCEARRLQSRYDDEFAMQDALGTSELVTLTFCLLPPARRVVPTPGTASPRSTGGEAGGNSS
jgi:hypothetical protein